jgi:hypothetical protein
MTKLEILKDLWDTWMHKDWFDYANYENEASNKIIVKTKYYPALEMTQFRIFMGKYPNIKYEIKWPKQ